MNITIYQIDMDRDEDRVCFLSHENLARFQGSEKINSAIYDKVFTGKVDCNNLEDVYCMFNLNHPDGYKGRSLSVSDVVEVCEDEEVQKGFYFCDDLGFKEVEFDPLITKDKTKMEVMDMNVEQIKAEYPVGTKIELINMDGENSMYPGMTGEVTGVDDIGQIHMEWENGSSLALNMDIDSFKKMEPANKISVLLVQPGKYPKMIEIEDSLESMQKVVGGDIEEYMPFEDEVAIVCNEEGKFNGMPLNRAIYDGDKEIVDIIAGDFFIASAPPESENFLSLSREMADKYHQKFKFPEHFVRMNEDIVAVPYKPVRAEKER